MARSHGEPLEFQGVVAVAGAIAVGVTVLEIVGGIFSNSLALLGDAGHVGADALFVLLTLSALRVARRPHTLALTYGYHRAEVLAALANGAGLVVIAALVLYEAYRRLWMPPQIHGSLLFLVALVGLAANVVMLWLLRRGQAASLPVRGAYLHVFWDTISSTGVLVGSVAILAFGVFLVDPIVAVFIGALIVRSGVQLGRDAVRVLMEGTPAHINLPEVIAALQQVRGVRDVHDVHVWTITSGLHALSGHLVVEDQRLSEATAIVAEASALLQTRFGIQHSTLQTETLRDRLLRLRRPM